MGRAKTVYRQGLSHRYGRRMQTISSIHYNFSVPEAAWPILQRADGDTRAEQDYRTAAYFGLIRNFRRRSWLLLYLFGASPAACSSFLAGHPHGLQSLEGGTLHLPYATSLRMGPLGYQSDVPESSRCFGPHGLCCTRRVPRAWARSSTSGLRGIATAYLVASPASAPCIPNARD